MCQDMGVGKCIFWAIFWQGASICWVAGVTEMKTSFLPCVGVWEVRFLYPCLWTFESSVKVYDVALSSS